MRLVENNKTTTDWKKKKEQLGHIKTIAKIAYNNIKEQIETKLKNDGYNLLIPLIDIYLDEHLYKHKKIGFYGLTRVGTAYAGSVEVDCDMVEDFREFYNNMFFYMEGFNETLRS